MRIGFIGTGHVASAFGRYLHLKGVSVSGFFDRHPEKMARAAETCHATAFATMAQVAACSDMVLLTTRDDQIETACLDLCRTSAIGEEHLVGHMSGACSTSVLEAATNRKAAVFSLHPLQAFADPDKAVNQLPATFFSLEGDDPRLDRVKNLMNGLGNPLFTITAEQKPLYHLAACIMSNYLVTLMDLGLEALKTVNIEPDRGFKAMLPLIKGTLDNIEQNGTVSALTGPIARADISTVDTHLKALIKSGKSGLEQLYRLLGSRTLPLAQAANPSMADRFSQLARLLENGQATELNQPRKE